MEANNLNSFQIVIIILTSLGLLASIIGVYIKSQIDITRIQTTIKFLQRDLDNKEIAICNFEKENKTDHKEILNKIDFLLDKINRND